MELCQSGLVYELINQKNTLTIITLRDAHYNTTKPELESG